MRICFWNLFLATFDETIMLRFCIKLIKRGLDTEFCICRLIECEPFGANESVTKRTKLKQQYFLKSSNIDINIARKEPVPNLFPSVLMFWALLPKISTAKSEKTQIKPHVIGFTMKLENISCLRVREEKHELDVTLFHEIYDEVPESRVHVWNSETLKVHEE